jgi:hypothetical protein
MNSGIITNDFDVVYNGKFAVEVIYKQTINTPFLNEIFQLRNVIVQENIPFAPTLSKITKAGAPCNPTYATPDLGMTNKPLITKIMGADLEQCWDTLEGTVFQEVMNQGVDRADLNGTIVATIILNIVRDALRRDIVRIAEFGDEADLNDDYNQMTGRMTTILGQTSAKVADITTFSSNSYTADNSVYQILWDLYNSAPPAMKALFSQFSANVYDRFEPNQFTDKPRFEVTTNLFNALIRMYQQLPNTLDGVVLWEDPQSRMPRLRLNGLEVIERNDWTEFLNDPDNPQYGSVNTIALLTTRRNHYLGYEGSPDKNSFRMFYDRYFKKMVVQSSFGLGYLSLIDDLNRVSFGMVPNSYNY